MMGGGEGALWVEKSSCRSYFENYGVLLFSWWHERFFTPDARRFGIFFCIFFFYYHTCLAYVKSRC